jgi:hypothetical protein
MTKGPQSGDVGSMRQRLGGFVLLTYILDKGRAKLANKNAEYNYNSPTCQGEVPTAMPKPSPSSLNMPVNSAKLAKISNRWFDALDLDDHVSFGGKA